MRTPVLLTLFNRPDTTREVFSAIREARPSRLYISADAPRSGNMEDGANCAAVRAIVERVDWPCDVHYRYLARNLGCGRAMSSAISWVFEQEEYVIIIEDDCVPAQPFFDFCEYLLEKYKDDQRVWMVSGRSHHPEFPLFRKYDYIFSLYGHIWGWATWKRCWQHFDLQMRDYALFVADGGFCNVFGDDAAARFHNECYGRYFADRKLQAHTWDYQWAYSRLKNHGLCVVPGKNLVQNIGTVGTHTGSRQHVHMLKKHEEYRLRNEPPFVLAHRGYERMHFDKHIRRREVVIKRTLRSVLEGAGRLGAGMISKRA